MSAVIGSGRRSLAIAAAGLLSCLAACGSPAELPQADGEQLALSRARIDAARTTAARLIERPAARERLLGEVRRIVAAGSLESEQLDEFGLAAIGELHLAVPSLVLVDRRAIPRSLDRAALRAFIAHVESDPARALRPAAAAEVERIKLVLADADAGRDDQIPVVEETVSRYLEGVEGGLRPIWPDLADAVAEKRREL